MHIKKAKTAEDHQRFLENYIGEPLDQKYPYQNDTYLLVHKGTVIGGYILAQNQPFRSIELIASEATKEQVYNRLKKVSITEVSCVWLKKEHRKKLASKVLWVSVFITVMFIKTDYFLFATIFERARQIMDYPAYNHEILRCKVKEELGGQTLYVFLSPKKHSLVALLQSWYFSWMKPKSKPPKRHAIQQLAI